MSKLVRHESEINTPELRPAHQTSERDDDEREATELGPVRHQPSDTVANPNSIDETSASNVGVRQQTFGGVRRWWKHYIQLHVPHETCRDHLGMSIGLDPVIYLHLPSGELNKTIDLGTIQPMSGRSWRTNAHHSPSLCWESSPLSSSVSSVR